MGVGLILIIDLHAVKEFCIHALFQAIVLGRYHVLSEFAKHDKCTDLHSIYQCLCDFYRKIILPHASYDVRLRELYDNRATPQLVTGVAGVPVVLSYVTVYQGISTSTHALCDYGIVRYGGYIF